MARTSMEWWASVLASPEKFNDWLRRQYQGETAPVARLSELSVRASKEIQGTDPLRLFEWISIIPMIINDERRHSEQVAKLMKARGLEPKLMEGYRARYFKAFHPTQDIYELAAQGAYAEFISLTRFGAIVSHPETPADVREEFTKILFDEEFHYVALRRLAGPEAFEKVKQWHLNGLALVGINNEGQ